MRPPLITMASTAELERLRQQHEDLEQLKQLAAAALQSRSDPSNPHARLSALHPALDTTRTAEQLTADLSRAAGVKARQLHSAHTTSSSISLNAVSDPLSVFYGALRELRDAYRTNNSPAATPEDRDAALLATFKPAAFSGAEEGGAALDLDNCHRAFTAATGEQVGYVEFVRDRLTALSSVPPRVRSGSAWRRYITTLVDYLTGFAHRAHPLDGMEKVVSQLKVDGRNKVLQELRAVCERFDNNAEAMVNGMGGDGLRDALLAAGLKSGGRPIDRARRIVQAAEKGTVGETALGECVARSLADKVLRDERSATVAGAERKQAVSFAELAAERDGRIGGGGGGGGVGEDEDEEDGGVEPVYNPKDVPLGWDGKPMPYWMYKLHGLNHQFRCEICGGAIYRGPRAFERHFTEAAHVGGLRRLGLSYSKALMMVTGIEDAVRLGERIRESEREAGGDAARETEVEDDNGNVMSLVTYRDMQRQGLV